MYGAIGIVTPSVSSPERESCNTCQRTLLFECAHQLTEGDVALAAHDEVDSGMRRIAFGGKAGIVSADCDQHIRPLRTDQLNDLERSRALESHDGEADDVRLDLGNQLEHGRADAVLHQDQI